MNLLFQDLRYALRIFRKSPGLSAVIVLSLAIGIGANTAIFSVVDALLLRPLPFPDPDRLAVLWLRSPGIGILLDWPSPGQFNDLRTQSGSFDDMAISHGSTMNLTGLDQPHRVDVLRTGSNLFPMLGARPVLGRLLLPEDDQPGKQPVAVLSHGLWTRLYGSDPGVIGKTIQLNGNPFIVAGVVERGFELTREAMQTVGSTERIEMYVPLPQDAGFFKRRGDENYNITARLKRGVSVQQAQADVDVIAARIRTDDKRDRTFTISVVSMLDQVVGDVRRAVLVMLGAVALVLLIACANVANLLLSRAGERQKEIAVRTALGARPGRVIRQLLTESVLLGVLGGAAGLAVAWGSLYMMRTINPGNIPRMESIGINGGVLAFTFAVSILTGIVFGLAPALRVGRVDLNTSLKAGGRASQGAGGFAPGKHRLRSLLVVTELSLSLMLLIGAGLLIRSFQRLSNVSPGFNADHVITMRLAVSGPRYRQSPTRPVWQYYEQLAARVRRLPGVKSYGAVSVLPLTQAVSWGTMPIEGYMPPPGEELQIDQRTASSDYFHTLEVPLLHGRFFNDQDTPDKPPVVIVDEKMAERFWPGGNAIGKRVGGGPDRPWSTIVGVVKSVKQYGLEIDGRMVIYRAQSQGSPSGMFLVARTSTDPASLASAMVREIHAVDSDVPVYDVRTMDDRIHGSLARQRFSMAMLAAFAGFALVLAAVGIYGVMSYLVTQGTHDIGVRIALGAESGNILRMVVGQGMRLASVGIVLGLAGAAALTRVMASLLFGVSTTDVVTFSSVAVFLALTALAASYIPARRATRVDPIVALREE